MTDDIRSEITNLNDRVNAELERLRDNPYLEQARAAMAPGWFDRLFSGIHHQWQSLTHGTADFLHNNQDARVILGDVADRENVVRWFPAAAGSVAAIGAYIAAESWLPDWLRNIPIVGSVLGFVAGGAAWVVTSQLLKPYIPGVTNQHLPLGTGTVNPLGRDQILRDRDTDVPLNAEDGNRLPPIPHPIPEVRTDNSRNEAPIAWRDVQALQIEIDNNIERPLGPGTVQPMTAESLMLQGAANGVATIRVGYQNWQETMGMPGQYTRNFREQTRPAIIRQLQTLGMTVDEARDRVPDFNLPPEAPNFPTLPDNWGRRACQYMLDHHHEACTRNGGTLTSQAQWGGVNNERGMNNSEKLNLLESYFAHLDRGRDDYVRSGLNWIEDSDYRVWPISGAPFNPTNAGAARYHLNNLLNHIGVSESDMRLGDESLWANGTLIRNGRPISSMVVLPDSAGMGPAAVVAYNAVVGNGTSVASRTVTRRDALLILMQNCIDAGCFNGTGRRRAEQVVEWLHSRQIRSRLNGYSSQLNSHHRPELEQYGRELRTGYNQRVRLFREEMEILDRHRVDIRRVDDTHLEIIDVRNSGAPIRYHVEIVMNGAEVAAYNISINGAAATRLETTERSNIFSGPDVSIRSIFERMMPVITSSGVPALTASALTPATPETAAATIITLPPAIAEQVAQAGAGLGQAKVITTGWPDSFPIYPLGGIAIPANDRELQVA